MPDAALEERLAALPWDEHLAGLDAKGYTLIQGLLTPQACDQLAGGYEHDATFRACIHMARYGFGSGTYKYFAYPLPDLIATLRAQVYPRLAPLANAWNARLGIPERYPPLLDTFIAECATAGQHKPTPLLLRYTAGDYNCLHRDLYGDVAFPMQMVVLLSQPGSDFAGGEFVITEQRPRMQSRATVLPLTAGDALIFSVNRRPVKGTKGYYSVYTRHGVSDVRDGNRFSLGIIFHDAK